jgi:hypothetical protein
VAGAHTEDIRCLRRQKAPVVVSMMPNTSSQLKDGRTLYNRGLILCTDQDSGLHRDGAVSAGCLSIDVVSLTLKKKEEKKEVNLAKGRLAPIGPQISNLILKSCGSLQMNLLRTAVTKELSPLRV